MLATLAASARPYLQRVTSVQVHAAEGWILVDAGAWHDAWNEMCLLKSKMRVVGMKLPRPASTLVPILHVIQYIWALLYGQIEFHHIFAHAS